MNNTSPTTAHTAHEARIKKAKCQLILDHPFFGTLATKLKNVIDPTIKTTATDGKVIRWNPVYLAGLTDAQVRGVIAHDVLHAANGHTWRRDARDRDNWDHATDKVVNGVLTAAGLELPKGEVMPLPHEVGKAAETLYAAMPPKPKNPNKNGAPQNDKRGDSGASDGHGGGQGKGKPEKRTSGAGNSPSGGPSGQPSPPNPTTGCGQVLDAPPEDAKALEADWKVAVAQAAEAAKSCGSLPGQLQRMVDEIVNPKVAWEVLLRDFIERTARNDFNWSRPNRRYLDAGVIMPSLISEELPAVVLVVDTSGSIGKAELDQFAAEVSAILGAYETTIHVLYADTRVAHHQEISRADLPLVLEPRGGGGTDFKPAFEWVEKQDITPCCLLYLTDLHCHSFPAEPDYPTLWISTTACVGPFGETVRLELGN